MVKEGIPFVLIPALLVVLLAIFQWWILAAIFLVLCLFMAFFFRDPSRTPPIESGIVVSAADGRVTRIDETDAGKRVSVFLSPFDVHINRSPLTGVVTDIEYISGRKLPATSNNASFVNERNSLIITSDDITVTCTQIAGIVARRIVCWAKTGDKLKIGEKFGLIKFSSRTDLLLPAEMRIAVKIGDKVRGGETIIARMVIPDH